MARSIRTLRLQAAEYCTLSTKAKTERAKLFSFKRLLFTAIILLRQRRSGAVVEVNLKGQDRLDLQSLSRKSRRRGLSFRCSRPPTLFYLPCPEYRRDASATRLLHVQYKDVCVVKVQSSVGILPRRRPELLFKVCLNWLSLQTSIAAET